MAKIYKAICILPSGNQFKPFISLLLSYSLCSQWTLSLPEALVLSKFLKHPSAMKSHQHTAGLNKYKMNLKLNFHNAQVDQTTTNCTSRDGPVNSTMTRGAGVHPVCLKICTVGNTAGFKGFHPSIVYTAYLCRFVGDWSQSQLT